jgi:uncharacterized protein YjbI with pentapeptide repeats
LWLRIPRWVWIALRTIIAALVLIWWGYGYELPRAGFGETYLPKPDLVDYRPAKTFWDWLGLLIIPVLLAVGGLWFTHRREESERKRQDDRLREEALLGYIDRMAELMLEKGLGGPAKGQPAEDDPVRDVARSRTLLVLRRLDGERKGHLLRFLHESELIVRPGGVYIELGGADLAGAILRGADLRGAVLAGAILRGADLAGADLHEANLVGADLRGADLSGADLHEARLHEAVLAGARLAGAYLSRVILSKADLTGADLSRVALGGAYLREAILRGADLRRGYFHGADLLGADLSGTDLSRARALTQDQINSARGDAATQLPEGLTRPASWDGPAAT